MPFHRNTLGHSIQVLRGIRIRERIPRLPRVLHHARPLPKQRDCIVVPVPVPVPQRDAPVGHRAEEGVMHDAPLQERPARTRVQIVAVEERLPQFDVLLVHYEEGEADERNARGLRGGQERTEQVGVHPYPDEREAREDGDVLEAGYVPRRRRRGGGGATAASPLRVALFSSPQA